MPIKQHTSEQSMSQGGNQKQCNQKSVRIKEFSNVVKYKLDIQKSVEFLYTNSKLSEREIKKTAPLTITPKTIK